MKNVEDIYPLSPLQQGMLFHSLYAPESGVYVIQYSCILDGALDVACFRAAWQRVVARHPMLRTAFFWHKLREPHQVVRATVEVPWREEDWSDLDPQQQRGRLDAELASDRRQGFDLAEAPLLRIALLRLAPDRFGFVWTYHHLLLDGWSCTSLLEELFEVYAALLRGAEPKLPEVRPYRAYVDWLAARDMAEAEAFWRRELAGLAGPVQIGIGRPLRAGEAHGDSELHTALPAASSERLQAFTRGHQLTSNTVAQGAWAILLARYSGERDVTYGMVVSGRPAELPGVESIVGPFINTLPMRVGFDPAVPVFAWLKQLQARQLTLRRFEHSPLSKVQKWSGAAPDAPLFDTLFVFENYPAAKRREGDGLGLRVSGGQQVESTSFALTVTAEITETLRLRVSFDRRAFDAVEIARLLDHLRNLTAALVDDPGRPLGELPLLAAAERHQLRSELNDTASALPFETSLCRLIGEQVERAPQRVAVRSEEHELTYRDLDRSAGRLARQLQELGCGRGDRVGVYMERSAGLVVALLAVLRAGAAYLPLSPEEPRERLAFMVEDSGVKVVLTQSARLGDLAGIAVPAVPVGLEADDAAREAPGHGSSADDGGAGPDDPAYVLYTSGSTGRPKAVVVPHRGICNRLLWMQAAYRLTAADAVLQKTPFTFDVSVWEFFWPLLAGARLVVARPGGHRDPRYLAEAIGRHAVTVVHFVPSMLRQFLAEPDLRPCVGLRLVICSGEALSDDLREGVLGRLGAGLHNLYGPTEASVDVTAWHCRAGDMSVPIGRPIENIQVYVVDDQLGLAPWGVPGELVIGGVGLAQGYLARPDLTARAFAPDPLGGRPGARLYRTGDRVRLLPGGEIEFLGRIDHQVKIRGFRIELGEVEAALARHPAVADAVVVARPDRLSGAQRLVAYVVPRDSEAPAVDTLRDFLLLSLPEAMVPAAVVALPALPLTVSGKVDRRALPEPESARPRLAQEMVLPATPREEALARVWSTVLGVEQVGVHDNFFALGGDSILSLRVISKARDEGIELSLPQLFRHQTVRDLARSLESGAEDPQAAAAPLSPFALISEHDRRILPADVEDAYPLAALQAGMLFHNDLGGDSAVYHNTNSLRLRARLNVAALESALQALVVRHPALRTAFHLTGFGEPLQLIHRTAAIPLQVEDLSHLPPAEQERQIAAALATERRDHFDLMRPPLLRFRVHRRAAEEIQLTWSEHHAILDGWSVAALITELARHYSALLAGREIPDDLTTPASHYRDFVAQERLALASEESRRYWTAALAGTAAAELPRWPGASVEPGSELCHLDVDIPRLLGERLKEVARALGVPVKHVLLAAHVRALAWMSGEREVITGLVGNGRLEEQDADRVLGLFLNTLPLRLRLGSKTWTDLIRQVFAAESAMLPHRRFPLAELQRRTGGSAALFETIFTFIHFHVSQSFEPGGEIELLGSDEVIPTNFPLAAYFNLDPRSGDLHLFIDYDGRRFPAVQMAAIRGCYLRSLEAIAVDPNGRPDLAPLPASERHQVLLEWNDTHAALPFATCLHHLFAAQAGRTPEAPAVIAEGLELSYRELDRAADCLGARLADLGCRAGERVAVCLERGPEMVVALLGVLKAGAAYLPLDPGTPAERLGLLLADARPAALVTTAALGATLPAHGLPEVHLGAAGETLGGAAAVAGKHRDAGIGEHHPAYVIYTSGSTGRPKAVVVPHGAICNRILWMQEAYRLTAADRVLQKTLFTFDVSVWEFFWPLATGAGLVVARPGGHRDPAYLAELIADRRVTVLHFVPSMLREFLAWPDLGGCRSLRLVVCSGEALPRDLAERCAARLPAEVHNLYGPTEAAVDVTFWRHQPGRPEESSATVPIGRPIANAKVLVLDPGGNLLPIGTPGELHIGGVCLAQGYLGRPDLTAAAFVPGIHGAAGERLYRTGDRVRTLPGGEIEFLGRLDHQMKIRGFRVEAGEIEAHLAAHPAVRGAAVIVEQDAEQNARLVAYVVPDTAADREQGGLAARQVEQWQGVFDRTYDATTGEAVDPGFDIRGWRSRLTGEEIPAEQMQEWVDATVARILAREPRRVLEIGCGTGLLLLRVAPRCVEYVGTDFSAGVLAQLERAAQEAGLAQVRLLQRAADDFTGLGEGSFDLVVLNSVVQYFPSAGYLEQVLDGAARLLRPGGAILIGDVRSLPLAEAFHCAVELARAPAVLPLSRLRQRVGTAVREDAELQLAPAFFGALAGRIPALGEVRIELKRGRHLNELTAFRYDVVLTLGEPPCRSEPRWLDWTPDTTLAEVEEILRREQPVRLGLRGVPNQRVQAAVAARRQLAALDVHATAGDLRRTLADLGDGAVNPERLWQLAERLSYHVAIAWSAQGDGGGCDAVFGRTAADAMVPTWQRPEEPGSPADHASDPLRGRREAKLVDELRSRLRQALPEYMVPAVFVLLDELPLTSSGKVDRRALPASDQIRSDLGAGFVAPRNETETTLAGIVAAVLQLERIGIHDSFFELGGHSLLALQLIARIREAFAVDLPLPALYRAPTVALLAEAVLEHFAASWQSAGEGSLEALLAEVEAADADLPLATLGDDLSDQRKPVSTP